MTMKLALTTLVLALLPALASAQCMDSSASACAQGQVWDAEAKACVDTTT